ncbi:SDR family NAD(P)-dependent oxidoreductase [Aureimonas phyllosphaerae]|uniref:NAD(P)-dependent dehydrogenase (Short-subunit alcohol dehydrogenase family) n=1 Tax=Aureimonas phyllosphaerae TaxID=1166078 RepID=A0A7W6BVR6_9HYPH|nr:SDR family NAD(P)-dependent oxidoreductase [Aureimonas phyllosphaerae]MBB3935620.1 NAD(P)-dependent dehydrogenase (short-subunit alcohol dehydrogenase family) [Aureimonas phyllosphaerae]MBB3959628.1 NAD(P)-dependent dehydrogenase (short-subunit alcohol dehydrogenase family) [Aureimonas phyllosphaerae]SFF13060.1 NAD(P)-dependent dehydrogenase, short-chain alcohol dehydrogenase family [Aureimonas phyllosphaerae]
MYREKSDLSGRAAFITGGGRGIGLCTAEALLEHGARVVISDRDPAVLEAGRAELAEKGWEIDAVTLDVTDSKAVARAAADANERHGGIDILIANAGIAWPDTPGESMTDEVWHKVVDVDLNGCYWSCREFGRAMLERGRGSIVTVGSMSGLISNKPQRQVHYNAAKAGVHHMTRSLAGEWAPRGVRVNSVAPTYVDTAMSRGGFTDDALMPTWMASTPMNRPARADEIASAILFLATDASSAMTGSIVTVDCGYTIW